MTNMCVHVYVCVCAQVRSHTHIHTHILYIQLYIHKYLHIQYVHEIHVWPTTCRLVQTCSVKMTPLQMMLFHYLYV